MEKQTHNQQASVFEGFSKRLQMTDAISLINPEEEAQSR